MSSPSSFIQEDIRRTVIFTLDGRAFPASLSWNDPEDQHATVARLGGLHEGHIAQLWQVTHRPHDLIRLNLQCKIVQLRTEPRPASFMKIILIDIDIYSTQSLQPFAMRRQARWMPRVINRRSVFRLLSLDEQFQEQEEHCYLWHNHDAIAASQIAPLRLEDGDYIQIHIGEKISSLSCDSASREASNGTGNESWNPPDVQDEDEHIELFQRSIAQLPKVWQTLQRQLQQTQLKVAPEHARATQSLSTTSRNTQQALRPRRLIHFQPDDLRRFGHLFRDQAITECEEEGPIAYLETWLIHHQIRRSCDRPRSVRIRADSTSWLDDILEPWEEDLDPTLDVVIHLVQPQPPCTHMECVLAHLIIEQSHRREHTIGLISIVRQGHRQMRIRHAAYSLPELLSRNYVLRISEVYQECQSHPLYCRVQQGMIPFGLFNIEEIPRAVGIVVELPYVAEPQSTLHDGTELMQRTITRWQRRAQPQQESSDASSTGGSCEGFNFNPDAPSFVPQPDLNSVPESIEELHQHWQQTAYAWEGESASTMVMTWFVDQFHPGYRVCLQPRPVRLFEDFTQWEVQLRNVWRDRSLQGAPIMIHVVEPPPPQVHPDIATHVLLVQNPQDTMSTIVLTGVDSTGARNLLFTQMAVTMQENFVLDPLLMLIGLGHQCLSPGTQYLCMAWYGNTAIPIGTPFPIRDGYGIILRVGFRPVQPVPADANALLQTALCGEKRQETSAECRSGTCERLTAATVAHEQRPQEAKEGASQELSSMPISIETLVPVQNQQVAITLWHEHPEATQPPFVVVNTDAQEQEVSEALEEWNITGPYVFQPNHQIAVILDPEQQEYLWIYLPEDPTQRTDKILLRSKDKMTTHQHMRFLYKHGFHKAVIVKTEESHSAATTIFFRNVHALPPVQETKQKERTDWPTQQQPQRNHRPIFDGSQVEDRVPSTMLTVGVTIPELQHFFNPANHPLHRDLSGFEIPEICQQLIEDCVMHQRIDRLLIYADGSSQSKYKRKPPLWIEEHDISDSWCFAVFGENYDSDKLMFIGFQCQQVLYNEAAPHHLGTAHIGADAAECEAMCWAALWRLAQNHRIPTVFLTDSQLTRGQANGDTGASTTSLPFRTLRGLFQALQAVLPGDQLKIQHVMGHAGDAGNEFVDFFAKIEAIHSLHLPRQTFDSGRWLKVIPYLWMILHQAVDLPPLTTQGFDISAPELPALDGQLRQPDRSKQAPTARLQQVSLSICSANVRSLYTKPHGHAGKLDFLRGQMKQLQLNVVGIQEARSHAGQSAADQVLRISGGDQQGQLGVELWVNLTQPYAYQGRTPVFFQRMDFVVVEATPRTLLVLHDHPSHRFWFLVAHGPQSGRPQEEREEWWMHLTTLLFQHVQSDKIFILIDANAATGPRDDIHIFQHDDRTSVNTKYFTEFLREMDLAVPSTGARHEGPHHTWTSPIDEEQYRLDYVLLRTDIVGDCVHSQTVPEFDLGNSGDHIAVAIQVQWNAACSQLSRHCQGERGPGVQRSSITYQKMHDALTDYQPLPWAQDIETQVNHMNQFVHNRLRKHCSRQEAAPKKQCLSGEVWKLRSQRIRTKKNLVEVQQRLRAELLFKALFSWRNHAETHDADTASYMTTLLCGKLRIVACLHRLDRTLRHALQQAKGRALDEQLRQMPHDTAASTVLHEIKKIIGTTNFKKKKSTPLPLINRTDGTPCRSIQEVQDRWIHFFQFMECGERLDVHTLRQKWIANLSTFRRSDVHLCLQDLPSLTDLEQAFRNVKANKATGDDGIPSEICHACPAAMARITYTQLMKLCAHGQEALLHKGGKLVTAFKHKGSSKDPSSYRSLMISSHIAKTLHRSLRSHQADYYERFMQQQQIGGRRKVPVQLGTHMVRAHLRIQAAQGRSAAVLFLDLQEAFYRVLRPLALGDTMTDEAIGAMMQRLRLPPSAMTELARLLDLPGATEQAGLPQHLRMAMCAIHTDTHFHVEGQSDRVRTQAGSRPGDPFADVDFGYLFSRILGVVEQKLIQEQLLDRIPEYKSGISLVREPEQVVPERPMLGPTWMDDLAICISGPTAIDLEREAALTAGILLETCMEHGVTPNLSRGKTELLLALRGKGSRNSRRAHFSERHGRQMQIVHEHGTDSIAVVGSYVHLGGKAHHSGENKVEARRRVSIANEAFNHHRRQLFQNSQISLQRRRELFDTLVMSKLCFGMESWTFRDQQLVNYIHGAIIRLYKRLLKVPANHHMDDYEVLATCRLPSPKTLFRRARLRYLLTLFNCEEAVPWGLFQQDQTWCHMLKDDLHWMWQQLNNTCTLRNPADHPEEWFYITRFHKKYWKTLVHRATMLDILKNSDNWQLRQVHFHVFDHLQSVGELNSPPPRPEVTPAKGMYGCIACGKKCRTLAGEAAHMFRCHGKVAEFRRFSDTTSCPACLREYHTVDRLHAHLRHGRRCQAQLRGMKMHRPITPGIGSQHNAVLKQRHDGLLPYQPAAGPPTRPMPLIDAQHHDLEAYEKIALECFEQGCHGRDHLRGQLFAIVQGLEISWTSLNRTVEQLIHDFTDENCELVQLSKSDIHHLLGSLRDPTHWPFLTDNAGDPEPGHRVEPLETYEVWSERLAQDFSQQPWHPDQARPHRPFAERIILHAYSGRRRHGDVQWFLEECAAQHPDVIMHVISLDIVINSHYGDIGREEVRARWYTGMRQGYVAGFLSGPPCCTWSKARGKQLKGKSSKGPRVLRDSNHLWGFDSVSIKEMLQFMDGRQLLGFSVIAMTILATTGGAAILEHPAEPEEQELASIWRLPLLQLLSRLPGMQHLNMAQGLLGAPSPKPTGLLVLNLPSLPSWLVRWAVCPDLPKGRSIGTDETGVYRTAELKEYPPAMCAAMAHAFTDATLTAIHAVPEQHVEHVPQDFLDLCQTMVSHDFGVEYGPDCVQ